MKTARKKARKPKKTSRTTKQKKARAAANNPAAKKFATRADFGAPIEGFLAKQPAHLRAKRGNRRRAAG